MWDHLGFVRGVPSGDPWIILSAVAASTTRLKLGLAVTPLARRRPQVVANAMTSLDLLSGGRAIFGAGLGGEPEEFTAFGEPGDHEGSEPPCSTRGFGYWTGSGRARLVTHRGLHYAVQGVSLAPRPLQRPRIPNLDRRRRPARPASRRPLGRVARASDEPRWDPDHGQEPRAHRRDGGKRSGGTGPRPRPSRWPSTATPRPPIRGYHVPTERRERPGGWKASRTRAARSTRRWLG